MRIKLYPLQPFPRTNKMHTRAVIFCCWFSLVHCVFFSLVACAVLLLLFGLHFSKQEFLARTSFFLRSLVLLLLWLPPLFNAFTELFVLLFFCCILYFCNILMCRFQHYHTTTVVHAFIAIFCYSIVSLCS